MADWERSASDLAGAIEQVLFREDSHDVLKSALGRYYVTVHEAREEEYRAERELERTQESHPALGSGDHVTQRTAVACGVCGAAPGTMCRPTEGSW